MKKLLCILCLLVGISFFTPAEAYYYRSYHPYRRHVYSRHYGYYRPARRYYRHYRRPSYRRHAYRWRHRRYW